MCNQKIVNTNKKINIYLRHENKLIMLLMNEINICFLY